MRVLVTNDDGIHAEGIAALEKIAYSLTDDVWVVAPESEQSGVSHSLTIRRPLRLHQKEKKKFAVDGTPTDCVLMAIKHVMVDNLPDLVLSGINHGSNVGEDVTYSGTISAAMEAGLFEIPAIALSQRLGDEGEIDFSLAEKYGPELIKKLYENNFENNNLISINFPFPAIEFQGVQFLPQGKRKIGDNLYEYKDPRGKLCYWVGNVKKEKHSVAGSDLQALKDGYIVITPLNLDLTNYVALNKYKESFNDW